MDKTTHIDIGVDFNPALGPRYRRLGPFSGEQFFEDLLDPAYQSSSHIIVHLDSIKGYSASFFEEAFGGLVRKYGLSETTTKVSFDAISRRYLIPLIRTWMEEAESTRNTRTK